ncbi:MAG: LysR family transcriptional regulator [Gemmatimonadaceae bacterium]|nr:LysR family transcriptional regulator [Gemmatimonadaceae bacterium]
MELRQLRSLVAVSEEKTFVRAAQRLHLTQPGLSRQIRDLERDLGFSLVERETRGIVPTPAGQALYFAARSILHEVARLPAELERARRAATGRCTIAAVPSAHIRDVLSTVLREGALLPTSHPLASRSSIRFEDLGSMPFMFFRRDFHPAFHDFVFETFRRLGYRPVLGPMQEGLQTLWSLASEGKGWSLAFGSHRKSPPPGLIAVPIEGFHIPWGMSLLTRRGETRATTLALVDMILEAAKQIEQS